MTDLSPKYRLLKDEGIIVNGHKLYRIQALRDFGDVEAGDLGGFIESEDNLSHEGDCWVADNACVFEYARVRDDAIVSGNAKISGYATIDGDTHVSGNTVLTHDYIKEKYQLTNETREIDGRTLYRIQALRDFRGIKAGDLGGFIETEANLDHEDDCWVGGNACAFGEARITHNAYVSGNARVFDNAFVGVNASIWENAQVFENAEIYGGARISGHAKVSGYAKIYDHARIEGNAQISGKARVMGNAQVSGGAHIDGDRVIDGDTVITGE
ncbi:hypothetical protein [Bartonella sp. DGB2]|uniref:hypothetical protein n=1 Tax=Bartonella sp. DGB2 TaxID=3388426 RepID=UPI003990077E